MNSESLANPLGVVFELARGVDLFRALLRIVFLAVGTGAPFELVGEAFESSRGCLPNIVFVAPIFGC